jgi:hypothetical protein
LSSIPKFHYQLLKFIGLKERNFFLLLVISWTIATHRSSDGNSANNLAYTIPNIRNTFVKTLFKYQNDLEYYEKSIAVERPSIPLSKMGRWYLFRSAISKRHYTRSRFAYVKQNFKFSSHDFWVGKAFQLLRKYIKWSNHKFNSIRAIFKRQLPWKSECGIWSYRFLTIGFVWNRINTRQFVQDRYIFRNGIIEDVPIGRIFGLTFGYQYKNFEWRPYLEPKLLWKISKWVLSTNFEVGTFFNNSKWSRLRFLFNQLFYKIKRLKLENTAIYQTPSDSWE